MVRARRRPRLGQRPVSARRGAVYARSNQVKDPFQGYKWLTIAANTLANGPQAGVTADQATTLRTLIEGELNKDQIAKARAEAKAFKPKG